MLSTSFNPRTPCGVRLISKFPPVMRVQFQSTHSLRSATIAGQRKVNKYKGFNPRTPCGVRLISKFPPVMRVQFQSTHSLRSATFTWEQYAVFLVVSIHALLAECDRCGGKVFHLRQRFNPRTPCGVRRFLVEPSSSPYGFNPRTPCGVRLLATGNNVRCDRDHGKGVNLG